MSLVNYNYDAKNLIRERQIGRTRNLKSLLLMPSLHCYDLEFLLQNQSIAFGADLHVVEMRYAWYIQMVQRVYTLLAIHGRHDIKVHSYHGMFETAFVNGPFDLIYADYCCVYEPSDTEYSTFEALKKGGLLATTHAAIDRQKDGAARQRHLFDRDIYSYLAAGFRSPNHIVNIRKVQTARHHANMGVACDIVASAIAAGHNPHVEDVMYYKNKIKGIPMLSLSIRSVA